MKLKYILSVLLVILVSGCIGGTSEPDSPVIQGDSGLEFEIQGLPESIRSNSEVSFIVEAVNYGGYSIPEYKVQIELANSNFFQTELIEDLDQNIDESGLTNAIPLNKRHPELNRGDTIYFNYEDVLFTLPAFAGDTTSVSVGTCYYYQTKGLADICISDDSYGEICNAIGEKETFSSAGPVKVRSISQSNSLKIGPPTLANIRSTMQFKLEYVGDGAVYAGSDEEGIDCVEGSSAINTVRVNSIKVGNVAVLDIGKACGGSNIIGFDSNNQAVMTCVINTYEGWTTQLGEFEERLTLNLDYIERDVVSKDLSII